MGIPFELTRDAEAFARVAQAFLEARIERNVLATVLLGALRDQFSGGLFCAGVDSDGTVIAAALRTPPWPMLVSEIDADSADVLVTSWLAEDPDAPGVTALAPDATVVAEAWRRSTGGSWTVARREALHVLDQLHAPQRPAPGCLREARAEERELLVAWERAFAEECRLTAPDFGQLVDARLNDGRMYVWDDRGPVCVVANAPPVSRVIRLGPVYTPPELRGRGYASSAVAARSRLAINDGHRCSLFTDLANPTSNKIYADIGYRRIADWNEIVFGPPVSRAR